MMYFRILCLERKSQGTPSWIWKMFCNRAVDFKCAAGAGLALFFLLTASASATTRFVRAGGSGTGASWAAAWSNLSSISWSALSPGDVVCVAGGSYSGSINTAKSGTSGNPITIRRATASDPTCGSSTSGWSSSYDAQVVMTGNIEIDNDYITIDGAVSNGISVTMQNPSGSVYEGICFCGGPTTGGIVRYVEVAGPCGTSACAQNNDHRSLVFEHWNGSDYDKATSPLIQYVNLHGACNNMVIYGTVNLVVEHSRMADSATTNTANCHPNIVNTGETSGTTTWRYNEMTNWQVEGIMLLGGAGWDIYGNIWHDPMQGSYPRVVEAQNGTEGPVHFYNNTVVNLYYICASTSNGGSYASGTIGEDNLYIGNNFANCGLPTEDYDYSDQSLKSETHGQGSSTNPFVSLSGQNFELTKDTSAGLSLASPYNVDYVGVIRGSDGTWDRGAYQFVSQTTQGPNPATSLTVTVR